MEIQKGNSFQANSTHFLKYFHKYGMLCVGDTNSLRKDESFTHCWIEVFSRFTPYYRDIPDCLLAIDVSNGKQIIYPRDVYYRIAGIDKRKIEMFTAEQYTELARKHKTFGPFEVDK